MLLARAPVRVSLAGGGTDLESYCGRYGGMVVSAAIDKYFYAFVSPGEGSGVQISSSDYRTFYRWSPGEPHVWDGHLQLPRAILHHLRAADGLSMFLASEVPPGTGLGSSSAVAVAMVKALTTLQGRRLTAAEVAEEAAYAEIELLGTPIGKQDHYAAAFGGVNALYFHPEGVRVEPLPLKPTLRDALQERLLLFFTGASRTAYDILEKQHEAASRDDRRVLTALHGLKAAAVRTREALLGGDLQRVGEILHESWQLKRGLSRAVSNPRIDEVYERARRRGAVGGKLAGAGGGGFMLLFCEPDARDAVVGEMRGLGLYQMDFRFDFGGAMVLMNSTAEAGPALAAPVALRAGRQTWREAYVF